MTIETKHNLNEDTIEALQDLVTVNVDSQAGLSEAAELVEDSRVAQVFRSTAAERSNFASELQAFVQWNDEEACRDKSFAAKIHQTFTSLRSKLNGGDAHVVLIEAEYGEDHIKEAYEEAMKDNPGSAVSDVLHKQYAVVKQGHDRIRDLRDEYAKK